jgi:hypothetical protein
MNGLNNVASSQQSDAGNTNSAPAVRNGGPGTPMQQQQQQQQAPQSLDLANRLSKLEQLTRQVGTGGVAAAAVTSSRRIASTSGTPAGANPSSPDFSSAGRGAAGAMGRLVSQQQSPAGPSESFDQAVSDVTII